MPGRGYVERRPSPRDGRARLVFLSERGQQALNAARQFHQRYERRLVRRYGAEPVRVLRQLLEAMAGGPQQGVDPQLRALFL